MANVVYHLRQASMLTRYARLIRNPEMVTALLRLAEQHKELADQKKRLAHRYQQVQLDSRDL
jgi:hypothetical protein